MRPPIWPGAGVPPRPRAPSPERADTAAELNSVLAGFTHVVVNYREMERFRRNYRFAERFGPGDWQSFQRWLREDLEPQQQVGSVVIYRIPRQEGGS